MDIADKANIHAIRIPQIKGFNFSAGKMGLKILSLFARHKAMKKGFVFPDHFAGIVAGTSINEKWLCEIIDNLQEGVTEIMAHPGIDNKILQPYFSLAHNFEQELNALISNAAMSKVIKNGISLINFRDLTQYFY